jgi:hypothetical protein
MIVLIVLGLYVAYIPIAFVLVRIYFCKSGQHRPYARLAGRSIVLALFWGIGGLGVQGFGLPVPSIVGLIVQPLMDYRWWPDNFVLFLKSWVFYFVVYLIAMGIKKRSVTLGTWD